MANCQCSDYCSLLGLDSSHLHFLLRVMLRVMGVQQTVAAFSDFLARHSCGGRRLVTSSTTCIDVECFGRSGGIGTLHPLITQETIGSTVQVVDEPTSDLPTVVEVGSRTLLFDDGERGLAALLDANEDHDDVALVTYDEDAFDVLITLVENDRLRVNPIPTLRLLRSMYECGSLTLSELEAIAVAAHEDLVERMTNMSSKKQTRKMRDIEEILNGVALAAADNTR